MAGFQKIVCVIMMMIFSAGAANAVIDPQMVSVDWPDHKRDLTYCFVGDVPHHLKQQVRAAAQKWNDAETGWTLTEVAECQGDIKIVYDEESWDAYTDWEAENNEISECIITLGQLEYGFAVRMIMHEFGHAMRLGYFQNTDLSDRDLAQARTSAAAGEEGKEEVNTDPKDGQRGDAKEHTISGNGGQRIDLNLPDAVAISVTPFQTTTLVVDADLSWDSLYIYVTFTPTVEATPHEGFDVTIWYTDGDSATYWGYLWVTDFPPSPIMYPQAVAGYDTTVVEGEPAVLDGSNSYHDDLDVLLSAYCWRVQDGVITIGSYGAETWINLPPGNHTALLTLYDEYGKTSLDSLNITVNPGGVPHHKVAYKFR
jgi:hypothetical protein